MPSRSCAACKTRNRKFTQDCVAQYFPQKQLDKFECVDKVYGEKNVERILKGISAHAWRENAASSLVYVAQSRTKDPIFGFVKWISLQQSRLEQVKSELHVAKQELATYKGDLGPEMVFDSGYGPSGELEEMCRFIEQLPQLETKLQQQNQPQPQQPIHFDGAGPSGQYFQQLHELSSEFNRLYGGAGGQLQELSYF